ncbi:HmuY family protein [Sphingobacterium sp. SGR-19]|uniref:HmuY family protein n=1 Tax=Sphingobacterium sp. SGR-19 TaxID=2710886 RepID=UPI0013EE08FB|nr:HmuY family protein [Sphingobacterium sp. SGR-19]NGM66756.1 hypothetical protein [Sphingobacterium sp. SGR-19]
MMKTRDMIISELKPIIALGELGSCLFCIIILLAMQACGKDDDAAPPLEDGRSIVIYDLPGDTEASMGEGVDGKEQRDAYTFLFRFRDQRQIWIKTKEDSLKWLKTLDWDIAFTREYNSEVHINNAQHIRSPGFEGPATNTAVMMINQPYDGVTTAPSDGEFDKSDIDRIGWAFSESSSGWFRYSLDTHLMQPLPNRTYVIRLPNGKYAKLQLINAYKGNPPVVTNMNWPAPYFTFRYYVQEDGSKNLKTSE